MYFDHLINHPFSSYKKNQIVQRHSIGWLKIGGDSLCMSKGLFFHAHQMVSIWGSIGTLGPCSLSLSLFLIFIQQSPLWLNWETDVYQPWLNRVYFHPLTIFIVTDQEELDCLSDLILVYKAVKKKMKHAIESDVILFYWHRIISCFIVKPNHLLKPAWIAFFGQVFVFIDQDTEWIWIVQCQERVYRNHTLIFMKGDASHWSIEFNYFSPLLLIGSTLSFGYLKPPVSFGFKRMLRIMIVCGWLFSSSASNSTFEKGDRKNRRHRSNQRPRLGHPLPSRKHHGWRIGRQRAL